MNEHELGSWLRRRVAWASSDAEAKDANDRTYYRGMANAYADVLGWVLLATDDRCPRCQKPGHATETDEDGYHPGCRPMTAAELADAIEGAHALGRDLLLDLGDKLRGVAEWLNCCEGREREFDYIADLATRLLHAGEVRS